MSRRWNILLAFVVVLAVAGMASACPSCKDSIANTDSAGAPGVSNAFNSSIYVMLGAFLGVLGIVFGVMFKAISEPGRVGPGGPKARP